MTPEKVKDILSKAKPLLHKIIVNYEKSGEGCMSRKDSALGWGRFDIDLCESGDDRSHFLHNQNSSYLLYMWQRWDEVDLVSFSCGHISKDNTANSSHSPTVSSSRNSPTEKATVGKHSEISGQVGFVGDGLHALASCEMQRQISALSEMQFQLEMKRLDFGIDVSEETKTLFNNRIKSVKADIQALKKRKGNHDGEPVVVDDNVD